MLGAISFILKLIVVYFIIGLLAMWLVESVLYDTLVRRNQMTKQLSDIFDHFFNLPMAKHLTFYGLCWPTFAPKLMISIARFVFL